MITPETDALVQRLFPPQEHAEVRDLLARECGDNLPLTGPCDDAHGHARIRFAVLKLSEGDRTKLHEMVEHAKIDWRDVLVWAGFGSSLTAHQEWARTILEPPAPKHQ